MKEEKIIDAAALRLNLGAGSLPLEGWQNLDRKTGQEIFPLGFDDGTADAIRASHVLEHFPYTDVPAVLVDWVRVLKPGGKLQIAVPDFEIIARQYLAGTAWPIQGYLMGGQTDADDYHKAIFDREELTDQLRRAGLVGISAWTSEIQDCASLPVSLNLQGFKPPKKWPACSAVMTLPRLAFTENYFSAFEALPTLGIKITRHTGAYWGQGLSRAIEQAILEENPEFILTVDYDTVYTKHDVESLLSLMTRYPDADAIAPIQVGRGGGQPLMTIKGADGKAVPSVPMEDFRNQELRACATAHFGLTILRTSKLMALPKPWFLGVPNKDGRWIDDKIDEDIHLWKQWEKAGFTLYCANRVPVGHCQNIIMWPGEDMQAIYQPPQQYWDTGKPDGVWR